MPPSLPATIILALLATLTCMAAADPTRPNILFIYLDDLGWRDTGFMGSDFYETPHLDALAQQGMVFTDAYSPAANCAPARASLLSGQLSPRHQIFNVGTGPRGDARFRRLLHIPGTDTLDPSTPTWSATLQAAGYHTAILGKWHLSDDPLPYGFDLNVAGTHSGSPPRGYYPPHPNAPGLADAPPDEYLTDTLSRRAVDFIASPHDRPWLLFLSHFAVHTPLDPKKELLKKYEEKNPGKIHQHVAMATMIEAVDQGVALIVEALESSGQREDTVIIFSSDNNDYGPATSMAPLKGYKGTYYEGGIRVPLFVVWPGRVTPGSRSSTPVSATDLFPTFCELASVDPPADHTLDGTSLVPLLTGDPAAAEELADRPLFWHFPAYLQNYSGGSLEQHDPLFRSRPCSAIRAGSWKLIEYFEDGAIELFNLAEDIGESSNLATSHPEQRDHLLTLLRGWRARTGAPIPTQPNPDYDDDAERAALSKAGHPPRH